MKKKILLHPTKKINFQKNVHIILFVIILCCAVKKKNYITVYFWENVYKIFYPIKYLLKKSV